MKIIERSKIDTPSTQIHDLSLSWLGTDTSIKSGGVKLVNNTGIGYIIHNHRTFYLNYICNW
jgi:hypothetical protein